MYKLFAYVRYRSALLIFASLLTTTAVIWQTTHSHAQKFEPESTDVVRIPADGFAPEASTISGRVFQDFNGNATYDTTTTLANNGFGTTANPIDRGVAGVSVTAFNASGVNVTPGLVATSDATGVFTIATNDVGTGPYRVEFTGLPTGYFPSTRSRASVNSGAATNAGSSVQFVSAPATDVNMAINYPTDYSQNNPEVVASMYAEADQITGVNNAQSVLVSFPYSAGSTDTATTATQASFDAPNARPFAIVANQVGTTFGLAYARRTQRVYAASYFKRHTGFGPQGPNAVYLMNRAGTGAVTNFFTVPGTATNSHESPANWERDNGNIGWDAVGKTSLGGIALSEDESILYVWNLANRTLYALNATTGATLASVAAPTSLPLPTGNCAAADVRPFALTMYRNTLYVGFVCSAQSSATVDTYTDANANDIWDQGDYFVDANLNGVRDTGESYYELTGNTAYNAPETFTDADGNGIYNLGDARGLRGYVYTATYTPSPASLTFSASPTFQFPLNYRRGLTTHTQSAMGAWRPWSAIYANASTNLNRTVWAQPMLTDIEFDNGNMIIGLRDRVGDQVGNGSLSNPNDASNTSFYQPRTGGDVLRACVVAGRLTLESNGRCDTTGTAPQNVAEGPGGGEFYFGDAYDLSGDFITPAVTITGKGGNHDDTGNGGVAQLPGAPDTIISNFDPIPNIANMLHDGGVRWLNNTTGGFAKAYRLYDGAGNDTTVFGKAGGIGGSFALLSDPAPIEIGNRIWRDTNGNGVQDPGELGFSGVTVRLYNSLNALVGTAVTDVNGEYYFVSSTVVDPTPGDNIGQVNGGIFYNAGYQIRFDLPADRASTGPLFGWLLTTANQTSQLGDDDSSDSDASNVTNPLGSPAGIFPVISVATGGPGSNNHTFDTGFYLAPSASYVSLQGRVTTAGGNGIRNVRVYLSEGSGNVRTTLTGSFGTYRFDDIEAGQNVVVSIASKRYSFPQTVRLVSLEDDLTEVDWIANE